MRAFVALICLVIAAPAAAQSTSIGVTANWDVARFSRVDIDNPSILSNPIESLDGEALGFGVSLRRGIGDNWGLAFEYSRSGEFENSVSRGISPIRPATPTLPTLPGVGQTPTIFPPIPNFQIELRNEQQHQTLAALAWVGHELSDRVKLSYTGGVTFVRSELEREYDIVTDPRLAIYLPPSDVETIDFGVGATVGVDADINFTDHTAFTAGVRLQSLTNAGRNGWLIRPAVGVRWTF